MGRPFSVFTLLVLVNLVEKQYQNPRICKRMRFQAGQILAGKKSTGTLIQYSQGNALVSIFLLKKHSFSSKLVTLQEELSLKDNRTSKAK